VEEVDSDNDQDDTSITPQEPDPSQLEEGDIVAASQPEGDIVAASQPDENTFFEPDPTPVQDVVDIEDSPDKSPPDKNMKNDAELGKLLGMATSRAEIEDKISELSAQLLAAKKQQVSQKLGPFKNSRL